MARRKRDQSLRLLVRQLEIPDCGCHLEKRPFCVTRRTPSGCDQRRESGDCDCAYLPGEPCPHVAGADHGTSLDDWAELLRLHDPEQYDDPPLPPTPAVRVSQEQELHVFAARTGLTGATGRPRFLMRHPDDVLSEQVDTISIQAGKGRARLGTRTTRRAA